MENDGEDNHHHVSNASCDLKQESTQEEDIEKHGDYSENSLIEEVVFGGTIDHEEVIQSESRESEGQKRKFSEMFEMSYSRSSKMTKLDQVSQSQLV